MNVSRPADQPILVANAKPKSYVRFLADARVSPESNPVRKDDILLFHARDGEYVYCTDDLDRVFLPIKSALVIPVGGNIFG